MSLSEAVARILFPACEPYRARRLAVGDGHEVYAETFGNPASVSRDGPASYALGATVLQG